MGTDGQRVGKETWNFVSVDEKRQGDLFYGQRWACLTIPIMEEGLVKMMVAKLTYWMRKKTISVLIAGCKSLTDFSCRTEKKNKFVIYGFGA